MGTFHKKKTNDEFLSQIKAIWGDKYDFSKVVYNGATNKVTVICPKHGEFQIRAADLLHGHGCPACGGVKRLTTQSFIERARKIHGDKYDYSLVDYKNLSTPVQIICHEKDDNGNEHGVFLQTPRNHLEGDRCPKCFKSVKRTQEQFLTQAKAVHGDKYDYSKSIYKSNKTPIVITCPKHGDFVQTPLYHLQGHGCQKCYYERAGQTAKKSFDDFVKEAKQIHGDKYDYSKVEYVNRKTPVVIICPKHGEFLQTPEKHLNRGQGCPLCSESHMERLCALTFEKQGIPYEREKKFDWLVNKQKLPLDFYLPDYKIAIECQGEQHYRVYDVFGGKDMLSKRILIDELKNKLCCQNGIKMYYLTHSLTIMSVSNIYNSENTFTDIKKLLSAINGNTLFEEIVRKTLDSTL